MQFWSGTAFMDPLEAVPLAKMLDEAGYDGMVCSDHMIYPRELSSPYPDSPTGKPGWAPETAWPDCWVLIGAMAAVTRRLRFSNAIYVAPARPLLEVAKLVATAAVVSEGRVSLAAGIGWMREEYELMGQDFTNRGKRLDEMIPALRELWRGGWVSWSGEHYQVPEMMVEPHPPVPVPILCGGESERGVASRGTTLRRLGGLRVRVGRRRRLRTKADRAAPGVRTRERAVRDPAGAARASVGRSIPAGRRRWHHRGDVPAVAGAGSRPGGVARYPGADRRVRGNHHRKVQVETAAPN